MSLALTTPTGTDSTFTTIATHHSCSPQQAAVVPQKKAFRRLLARPSSNEVFLAVRAALRREASAQNSPEPPEPETEGTVRYEAGLGLGGKFWSEENSEREEGEEETTFTPLSPLDDSCPPPPLASLSAAPSLPSPPSRPTATVCQLRPRKSLQWSKHEGFFLQHYTKSLGDRRFTTLAAAQVG